VSNAELAPTRTPHSFPTSLETTLDDGERQSVLVARLGGIVTDEALTAEEREAGIAALRETSGYGTLEFRMLHMFALHAAKIAVDAC
jgi:hypothetical protein